MIIKNLKLKNFKCFKKTEIEFGKITLLTGANSSGKSSLIDALLAVLQTEKFPLYLSPNGKYKNMGGFENISHQNKKELIEIFLDFPNVLYGGNYNSISEANWVIDTIWESSNKSAMPVLNALKSKFNKYNTTNIISEVYKKKNEYILNQDIDNNSMFENKEYAKIKDLKEDLFENMYCDIQDEPIEKLPIVFLKERFNYIHSYREEPERNYYQIAKVKNKIEPTGTGYAQQIAEWEETNPDKINLLTKYLQELKLIHSIKTEKRSDGTFQILIKTHKNSIFVPLTDVGFGVSKMLPLLVADLQLDFEYDLGEGYVKKNNKTIKERIKDKRSLLAISEPEIDLHPSVQADFGDYLANQAIENQKQYIVETHSEYLLNRLRLLIAQGYLKEEDVKIYFFENNGIETTTYPLQFKKTGEIIGAPDGFFETYETDVINIAIQD